MKKIFVMLALATFGSAYAGSAMVELQSWENPLTKATSSGLVLNVKENLTNNVTGDVVFSISKSDSTKAFAGRSETGLTYSNSVVGKLSGYVRGAIGIKHNSGTSDTTYYSVEPGVTYGITDSLSARLGYRYRTAFNESVADQTNTLRAGLSYALNKKDTIGIRLDKVRGDSSINTVNVNYTRAF